MLPHHQLVKHAADAVSAGAIVGAIAGWLPAIGAALGVIWYCLQIYWAVSDRLARKRAQQRRRSDR